MDMKIPNPVKKKKLVGKVVSDKMKKTVVVSVQTSKRHPKYHKSYTISKHYRVHDENNEYHVGDTVEIEESRPISKGKKWQAMRKIK